MTLRYQTAVSKIEIKNCVYCKRPTSQLADSSLHQIIALEYFIATPPHRADRISSREAVRLGPSAHKFPALVSYTR